MSHPLRPIFFRCLAGFLGAGALATAWWLTAAAHAGEFTWQKVLPSVILQLIYGPVFLLYAFGKPGPFDRQLRP